MKSWILRAPASADSHPLELADISRPVAADDEILVELSPAEFAARTFMWSKVN